MIRPTGMSAAQERFLGASRAEPMRSGFAQAAPGRQGMSQSMSAPRLHEEQARSTFTVRERSRSPERARLPGVQEEEWQNDGPNLYGKDGGYARQRELQQAEPSFLAVTAQQLPVPGGYRNDIRPPLPTIDHRTQELSPSPPMGSTWYGGGGKSQSPVVVQSHGSWSGNFTPIQGFENFGQSNASTWTGAYDSMGSFSSTVGGPAHGQPRWPQISAQSQGSEASPRLPRLAPRGAGHTVSAPQLPKVPQATRSMPKNWHHPRSPWSNDSHEREAHGAEAVKLVGKSLGF